ncbi:phosphopantetheine-binding protein [Streptomyces sp. NPDC051987]|uniref:phosphopantetheine-binding protein n=1 Tax=Streptomyces sp. NPDC051987 TaxID=3155808 RepID=UPI003437505B
MANEPSVSAGRFEQAFRSVVEAALPAACLPDEGMTLADAGLDSYQMLSLLMDLEGEFGSLWPVEKMVTLTNLTSVGDLRKAVWDLLVRGEP